MLDHSYNLKMPENATSCAVFNSAHSGSQFPDDFLSRASLSLSELRSSEDAFVDRLVGGVTNFGAPLLSARYSRAFVDINRSAVELDPALILDLPRQPLNPRVASGLGVLPRVVAHGKSISNGKISLGEANQRLAVYYHPYHAALTDLIAAQKQRFGRCHLFDFHSMPIEAIRGSLPSNARPVDIVLGNRFGMSCDHWFMDSVENAFITAGFQVARNAPFAGGFITQHYGKPKSHVHAVQIEINRALYMDEKRIEPLPDFDAFQATLSTVTAKIAALGTVTQRFAAE